MSGLSRTELVRWVNEVCQLDYLKIEECGTGAAYCQILDSIYGDVQINRVKFDCKGEHDNVANFKILQNNFDKHKIDKTIPVEKLVKMKMQDNLEFVQWLKVYWDANQGGEPYDALARRKGAAPPRNSSKQSTPSVKPAAKTPIRKPLASTTTTATPTTRTPVRTAISSRVADNNGKTSRASQGSGGQASRPDSSAKLASLQKEVDNYIEQLLLVEENCAHMHTERDFYYNKLREIELITQQFVELNPEAREEGLIKDIISILYSTEGTTIEDYGDLLEAEDLDGIVIPNDPDFEDETY